MYDFTYRKLQKIYTNLQQQKSDESLPGGGLDHGESWEGGITGQEGPFGSDEYIYCLHYGFIGACIC